MRVPAAVPGMMLWMITFDACAMRFRGTDWAVMFVFYTLPYAACLVALTIVLALLKAFRHPAVFYLWTALAVPPGIYFLLGAARAPGSLMTNVLSIAYVGIVVALVTGPAWIQFRNARPRAPAAPEARSGDGPPQP